MKYVVEKPDEDVIDIDGMSHIPTSLSDALSWFLLALGERLLREEGPFHSTMMIHFHRNIDPMERLEREAILPWLERARSAIASNDGAFCVRFKGLWNTQRAKNMLRAETNMRFQEVWRRLVTIASDPTSRDWPIVRLENSRSARKPDYRSTDAARYIVIGGDILSRGLTLEGLVCAWFDRNTDTADVLEQRARWFGRRKGYSDLLRIWLSRDLIAKYREIQIMNLEIRDQLRQASSLGRDWTPEEFIPRICLGMGMVPTSNNGGVVLENGSGSPKYPLAVDVSLEGELWGAAESCFRGSQQFVGLGVQKDVVYRGVGGDRVKRLLQSPAYESRPSHWPRPAFSQLEDGELWTVVLKLNGEGHPFERAGHRGAMATRGKVEQEGSIRRIGSVYSAPDFFLDILEASLPAMGMVERLAYRKNNYPPIMVIYPVEMGGLAVPMPAVLHGAFGRGKQSWCASGIESSVEQFLDRKAGQQDDIDPDYEDIRAVLSDREEPSAAGSQSIGASQC